MGRVPFLNLEEHDSIPQIMRVNGGEKHALTHFRPPRSSPLKKQCLKVQNNIALPLCGHFMYDVTKCISHLCYDFLRY